MALTVVLFGLLSLAAEPLVLGRARMKTPGPTVPTLVMGNARLKAPAARNCICPECGAACVCPADGSPCVCPHCGARCKPKAKAPGDCGCGGTGSCTVCGTSCFCRPEGMKGPKTKKATDGGPDWKWDATTGTWWRKVTVERLYPVSLKEANDDAENGSDVPVRTHPVCDTSPTLSQSPPSAFYGGAPMMMYNCGPQMMMGGPSMMGGMFCRGMRGCGGGRG
jgi:hypothetical protein